MLRSLRKTEDTDSMNNGAELMVMTTRQTRPFIRWAFLQNIPFYAFYRCFVSFSIPLPTHFYIKNTRMILYICVQLFFNKSIHVLFLCFLKTSYIHIIFKSIIEKVYAYVYKHDSSSDPSQCFSADSLLLAAPIWGTGTLTCAWPKSTRCVLGCTWCNFEYPNLYTKKHAISHDQSIICDGHFSHASRYTRISTWSPSSMQGLNNTDTTSKFGIV